MPARTIQMTADARSLLMGLFFKTEVLLLARATESTCRSAPPPSYVLSCPGHPSMHAPLLGSGGNHQGGPGPPWNSQEGLVALPPAHEAEEILVAATHVVPTLSFNTSGPRPVTTSHTIRDGQSPHYKGWAVPTL